MERFGRRGPSRSQGQTLDDPPSFRCDSDTSWCGPAQWASHTAIRPNHRITALGNRRDEGGAQSNRLTIDKFRGIRSEERRVGKECVSTLRSRWSPYHKKKKKKRTQRI